MKTSLKQSFITVFSGNVTGPDGLRVFIVLFIAVMLLISSCASTMDAYQVKHVSTRSNPSIGR